MHADNTVKTNTENTKNTENTENTTHFKDAVLRMVYMGSSMKDLPIGQF